jgi:hypothetical protein
MTEQELIEEGFTKIDVLTEDSGNQNDYYYYSLELNPDFVLTSEESDEVSNNQWRVHCYEINIIIKDVEDIQALVGLFKKWSKY